ncbi:K88 fimbrial protein AC precursor [compost metagenome]
MSSTSADLTNGGKTLTVPFTKATALLVGQTKAGFNGKASPNGLLPQLSFTGANNAVVNVNYTTDGNGSMQLVVVDKVDKSIELGNAVLGMKSAGAAVRLNPVANTFDLLSGASAPGSAFVGGVGDISQAIVQGSAAFSWTTALGSNSQTQAISLAATAGGVVNQTQALNTHENLGFNNPAMIFAATYGLGINNGQNLVVNFTNPVTATSSWSIPLQMNVTYI